MAVTLETLAAHIGGTLVGGGAGMTVAGASTLETAGPDQITLVDHVDKLHLLAKSAAGAAIVPTGAGAIGRPAIEVADVHAAFAAVITLLRPPRPRIRIGRSPQAAIDPTATLGADVDIHPFATVGADVEIGAGATIHAGVRLLPGCRIGAGTEIFPNAVLYENTRVGERCTIHAGAVIGAYGFGYKVTGEEYRVDCTKFDRLLLLFRDGHYQVVELPEKLFVGPDVIYCAIPERDRVFTLAYTNREATYLKRFTFGGTILEKLYHSIPPKSKILFFEPDTPAELFIKYKPAAYQKINQQTCNPSEVEAKGPKTIGRQISIKDVSSINSKPPRGWDATAPTTKLQFI